MSTVGDRLYEGLKGDLKWMQSREATYRLVSAALVLTPSQNVRGLADAYAKAASHLRSAMAAFTDLEAELEAKKREDEMKNGMRDEDYRIDEEGER